MTILVAPGGLAHAATDGTLPHLRERGWSNEIIYNADTWRDRSPVIVPHGADRDRWLEAFAPWWAVLAGSFAPCRLEFSRMILNRTPFAGRDADTTGMDEAWTRFGADLGRIVAATGFWQDDGDGTMRVNVSLKFHEGPGHASRKSSYLNLSRDLRLQRHLRPFLVTAADRLAATCPDWFAPFHEISFNLEAPRPSPEEAYAAMSAMPEVADVAACKLPRQLHRNPPGGWRIGPDKPKRIPPEKLYPGWDPLVDDVCYLEIHMDSLFGGDPWRPAWVAFLSDWHVGDLSTGLRDEV